MVKPLALFLSLALSAAVWASPAPSAEEGLPSAADAAHLLSIGWNGTVLPAEAIGTVVATGLEEEGGLEASFSL